MRDLKKKYKYWNALPRKEIDKTIKNALEENISYYEELIMGLPGSHLDKKEFAPDAALLNGSSYLQVLVNNPNHIGVHTLGKFEPHFKGTHQLEKEVINVISEDILDGDAEKIDGYVSSGGTEGNIQAIWIFRNYFAASEEKQTTPVDYKKTAILCSKDTHYSIDKAANLLNLALYKIEVDEKSREIDYQQLNSTLQKITKEGVENVIFVVNMMTTMFGSYDDISQIVPILKAAKVRYKIHVDGAYGGFLYPFSIKNPAINFQNEEITSFSLDAHKMLQAPYGTGIFLIRKGYFNNTKTESASYVVGKDYTLIGSRSGANAVSIYKILFNYGPYDWQEKMHQLVERAKWFYQEIKEMGIEAIYFEGSNIIAIHQKFITNAVANKYGLVGDNTHNATWYKVVIMGHVKRAKLIQLLADLNLVN